MTWSMFLAWEQKTHPDRNKSFFELFSLSSLVKKYSLQFIKSAPMIG